MGASAGGTTSRQTNYVWMVNEQQMLERIRQVVGHYLRDEITKGEAMSDVIDALVHNPGPPEEDRSWTTELPDTEGSRPKPS